MKKHLFSSLLLLFSFLIQAQDKPKSLGEPVNTREFSEFAPTISSDGKTLIFETNRVGTNFKLFESIKMADGKWSEPRYLKSINDAGSVNDWIAGPFFSYDDNFLYFTTTRSGGLGFVDIWMSKREGGTWGSPVNLGKPINGSDYDGFPSVSADGKALYYMRDERKLGQNYCYSIYVSYKQTDGTWGQPVKMPAPINEACESCPRIMSDNKTLIFSSIRKDGKGGFDLYQTKRKPDGTWETPVPLDYINTSQDDLLVSVPASGDVMYFTSGDNVSMNDDIFTITIPDALRPSVVITLKGMVTDKNTNLPLAAQITISGEGTETFTLESNADGKYTAVLDPAKKYNLLASADNYTQVKEVLDLTTVTTYQEVEKNFQLTTGKSPIKEQPKEPIVRETPKQTHEVQREINEVFFDFNIAKPNTEYYETLDAIAKMMIESPSMTIEVIAHTDSIGSEAYNLWLSEQRSKEIKSYLLGKGIAKHRVTILGKGESEPLTPNDTEENRKKNRRATIIFKEEK